MAYRNRIVPIAFIFLALVPNASCHKDDPAPNPPQPPAAFTLNSSSVDGENTNPPPADISLMPELRFVFSSKVKASTVTSNVLLKDPAGTSVAYNASYQNADSVLVIKPTAKLKDIAIYNVQVLTGLQSQQDVALSSASNFTFKTQLDSSDKFPRVTDDQLLDLIQQQTFKYFWDFAHPVSGLARERNTSGDLVTSGGSGFGIMAIVAATSRNFISRSDALARMQKIVGFLKNTAITFHGAYPHWLNGATGAVMPFSAKDDGADLVETSFLIQGLLAARQYFDGSDAAETALRNDINTIWNKVEWDWFRKNSEEVLYWHWSPNHAWDMNLPIRGWNECLITYVLAAASTTHTIPGTVYENGWARNGGIKNNTPAYGYTIPLGTPTGGPLFFSHYSFLGINPNGLSDQYANYTTQVTNHSKVNYEYCKDNPNNFYGYSSLCWGLTASDDINGYKAHAPDNDNGVITPTAAVSSLPFTPTESMNALKFFYYTLGNRLWKEYGFIDAFSLHENWFANSYLAIDQGPMIIMIENYRSQLLWNLFMSCPEVKDGLRKLGFTGPGL